MKMMRMLGFTWVARWMVHMESAPKELVMRRRSPKVEAAQRRMSEGWDLSKVALREASSSGENWSDGGGAASDTEFS